MTFKEQLAALGFKSYAEYFVKRIALAPIKTKGKSNSVPHVTTKELATQKEMRRENDGLRIMRAKIRSLKAPRPVFKVDAEHAKQRNKELCDGYGLPPWGGQRHRTETRGGQYSPAAPAQQRRLPYQPGCKKRVARQSARHDA